MRIFAIIFLLVFTLAPTFLIGKTKNNNQTKDESNKTTFDITNFKYSETNASGLSLIVLGSNGYYYENGDADIVQTTIYRQDGNLTEKFVADKAKRVVPSFIFDGNINYERSDGILIKSTHATYNEQNKTLSASPAYAKIKVNE